MFMEQEQPNDIDQQSSTPNNQQQLGVVHFFKFHQSLQSFHQDREAERH